MDSPAETIAAFKSSQAILHGRPAATERKVGRGVVVKLGFWPGDDSLLRLIKQLVPERGSFLAAPARGVAVPHADNSLFVVNTDGTGNALSACALRHRSPSGASVTGHAILRPYQVLWLA